jgi:DNA gyrase subunit A
MAIKQKKQTVPTQETILPAEISSVMRESYQDYAAAVVIGRAIPDVRDGLKPVHRRILYAMKTGGYDWSNQHRKSARIVGDVIGKFHPHGDTAVYEAMARLTQSWSVTSPLVDGQGNFGSPDGDRPAAMRYTEARLSPIAKELLGEINRGTVGFQSNYDGQETEPTVLPAAFPHILVNGGSGIAVGMASSIPPHNLGEILKGALQRLKDDATSLSDIMQTIKGPDFPTQGRIIGTDGILKAYETGRGTLQLEATAHYEKDGTTPVIIYTDMPYGVTKPSVLERIHKLIHEGKLPEVVTARDESDRNGSRFVIELKRGTNQENTDLRLKTLTELRTTISLNFTALDAQGVPREMGLLEILDNWILFRRQTVRRRATFDLRKARERGRLILGRIAALTVIDRIVKKIKESSDRQSAINAVCAMTFDSENFGDLIDLLGTREQKTGKRFHLTPFQAEDILAMRLQRLTGMERENLEEEGRSIAAEIRDLQSILNSPARLDMVICEEIEAMLKNAPQDRLTFIDENAIVQKISATKIVEPKEDCFVEITPQGLLQKRKKRPEPEEIGAGTIMHTHSHARIVFFTDLGSAYGIDVAALPRFEERKEDPRSLIGLVGQQLDGTPVATFIMDDDDFRDPDEGGTILVFTTEDGYVRRTAAAEFASIPSSGKMAMKIAGNDAPLLTVFNLNGEKEQSGIFVGTAKGKTIRFSLHDVRIFNGRSSRGVRAIKLDKDDLVISSFAVPISNDDASECDALEEIWLKGKTDGHPEIIQVASTGHLKRTTLHAYRQMKRDGKGMNDKGPAKTVGDIVAYKMVTPGQEALFLEVAKDEYTSIDALDIRRGGRASTGGKPSSAALSIKIAFS